MVVTFGGSLLSGIVTIGGSLLSGVVTIGGSLLSRGRYFRNSTVIDSKPPPNACLYSGRGPARGAGK